jgi:hypothetical protein
MGDIQVLAVAKFLRLKFKCGKIGVIHQALSKTVFPELVVFRFVKIQRLCY